MGKDDRPTDSPPTARRASRSPAPPSKARTREEAGAPPVPSMFERIFVAFDGTPESHRACQTAIEIASRFQSSVTVGTVVTDSKEPTDGHLESLVPFDSAGKSLAILIDEIRASALAHGVTSLDAVFLQGEVVPALLEFLVGHPHDLAVAGSRGLSRGRRILLGSVSAGLVNDAPCPVLVVRGAERPRGTRGSPSEKPLPKGRPL
jgi:nucleotide-binding universal stress UspA family protein